MILLLGQYNELLIVLQQNDFEFLRYQDFKNINDHQKSVILRHDIDARKENSLQFAKIEQKMGLVGTYYFRISPESFDENVISEIAGMGHEIGYHYENLYTCNGNIDKAFDDFCKNLEIFRKIYPVKTICMHGSPFSKFDNREVWRKYDYHKLGIIGEPYFDLDFKQVMYLTDTGRRWDGENVAVRDKAQGSELRAQGKNPFTDWKVKPYNYWNDQQPATSNQQPAILPKFHTTFDIIRAAEEGKLPDKIMMTFHPQRWTNRPFPWVKELVWQNVKNVGKYFSYKDEEPGILKDSRFKNQDTR